MKLQSKLFFISVLLSFFMTFNYYFFYFRLQHARTPWIFPCQRPCTYSWYPSWRQWCKSPTFACYSFLTLSIARSISHLDSDHRYGSHRNANHDHPSCGRSKYFGWIGTSYVFHGWCKRCVYWRTNVNYTLWVYTSENQSLWLQCSSPTCYIIQALRGMR